MKPITQNSAHAAAIAHLGELRAAEAAAMQAEARAADALAQPAERETALAAASRMLQGEPLRRVDSEAHARELADARQRLVLLRTAIAEQLNVIEAIRGELSAELCAKALPGHLVAAQGIVDALEGLRAALGAEQALRAGIADAGYACRLEPLQAPELNFNDSQSTASRLLRDVTRHLAIAKVRASKGATVALLVDVRGVGVAGDVLAVDGPSAAALLDAGQVEVTSRKPGRVLPNSEPAELVLS